MTIRELSDYLKLPTSSVYMLIKTEDFRGKIATKEVGRKSWSIDEERLERWVVKQQAKKRGVIYGYM